jgi:hypothetical protein
MKFSLQNKMPLKYDIFFYLYQYMNSVRHFPEIFSHIYNLNKNEIILLKLFGKSIAIQCCCNVFFYCL